MLHRVNTRLPAVAPPQLLSDTEAQAIWRRAADLQSLTGVQPRPTPILGERDAERDAERTSGYKVADIRGAASEAGNRTRDVDHALAGARCSDAERRGASAADGGRSRLR